MRAALLTAALWAALAASAAAQPGGDAIGRLMVTDANRDGAISKAEARAARETQFRRTDQNGDGFVTSEERRAAREQKRRGRGGDRDGDGKVSLAEFLDAPYRVFDMFDANKNDVLEASEIQAARKRIAQRKAGTP